MSTKRFTGSVSNRLGLLLCCLAVASGLYIIVFPDRSMDLHFVLRFLIAVIFGGMEFALLYGLLESFTIYRIDENKITRSAWNGQRSIQWRNLERFAVNGQRDGSITLIDSMKRSLTIHFILFDVSAKRELRALIEAPIEPIRTFQRHDLSMGNKIYYPSRNEAWVGVFFIVLLLGMAGTLVFIPFASGQKWAFYFLTTPFLALMLLFSLWFTLSSFTRKIEVNAQEISESSLLGTRRIPFDEVESVTSRMIASKNGPYELTSIQSLGRKIKFVSHMTDYGLLLGYVRERSGQEAIRRGDAEAEILNKRGENQARIVNPIITGILFLLFVCIGIAFVRIGNNSMATFLKMDSQGRTTMGEVVALKSENNNRRSLIYFAFEAGGKRIVSSSPVSQDDFQSVRVGAPISVIYLPGHPDICRAAQSIGPRKAQILIRQGYINLIVAFIVPPLIAFLPYLSKRKRA